MNVHKTSQAKLERKSPKKLDNGYEGQFVVGQDILELLSSSMYVDPLTIYREYVQNAVDSIDEAVEAGELPSVSDGRIDIILDHIQRRSVIRDNGIGLSNDEMAQRLTSFGASRKKGTTARGFRGVGRLAGLGYCQQLLFRSRSKKSENVLEVRWDCRLLKKLLSEESFEGDLEDLVRNIVTVRKIDDDDYLDRFFEVEIVKPRRIGSDKLLNEMEIESYLSQVAPCPFRKDFSFRDEIEKILRSAGKTANEYNIHLNQSDNPIYRPYSDCIHYNDIRTGQTLELSEISIDGIDGNLAAIGWILHHDYQGAIPTGLGIKGLRARVGNIQIGNDKIFSSIFPEERFSSWTIGEIHLLDRRILPNGRRDDFEQNTHLSNIITHLTPYGSEIARHCRSSSQVRNRRKVFELGDQKIQQKMEVIEQGVISKKATDTLKREIGTHLSEIRHAASFDLFERKERTTMNGRANELERQADNLADRIAPDDPLLVLPKNKQKTYREVFDLIYECSANGNAAKSLVDRILSRISKS